MAAPAGVWVLVPALAAAVVVALAVLATARRPRTLVIMIGAAGGAAVWFGSDAFLGHPQAGVAGTNSGCCW